MSQTSLASGSVERRLQRFGPDMRARALVLALLAAGTPAAAQSPRPLEKFELIRLLTNPLFAQSEVADVVRRSCVGFRPTERDWADLRNAGASGEVIASVAACDRRRTASSATARPVTVLAAVTDSSGNAVREEPVELLSGVGDPLTSQTDSLGRATFTLLPGALPRGGALRLRVRALPPVDIAVADAGGLSGTATGFMPITRRGRVGSPLGEALYFRARTIQGDGATGRVVRFRGVNARVSPDSAVLDSTGRVALDVTFGARAGEAMIVARIDSVEKLVTLPVEPGPIVSLVLEYGGQPVTGKRIVVPVATPFVVRLTARDFYGNETPIGALGQMLRSGRARVAPQSDLELEVVNLDVADVAVLIELKARRLGIYDFTIGSGITASLRVEAVRAPS